MASDKFVLKDLFVDRQWRFYDNPKGGAILFSVKFLNAEPPEGRICEEVKVKYDGNTQELEVGEAIVRRAEKKVDIDPVDGNALVDVEVLYIGKPG